MADDIFSTVELDTLDESLASPRVDPATFEGIRIAMPARRTVADAARIPLCGTWVLRDTVLSIYPAVYRVAVFLVRDRRSGVSFVGTLRDDREEIADDDGADLDPDLFGPDANAPAAPPDPDDKTMGWFNFDLATAWKVPPRPGQYLVNVVLDEIQSNVVEFEVTR